ETPIGRLPLNHRVTSLISSLAKDNSTSQFSRKGPASAIRKLSLPVTPPLFEKVLPVVNETPDSRTSTPALLHTPTLEIPKVSPHTRSMVFIAFLFCNSIYYTFSFYYHLQ